MAIIMHVSNTEQLSDAILFILFVRQEGFCPHCFGIQMNTCLHVNVLSAMDSGMHKVKLNKATLLVKEKSAKSVPNAPEILQGNGQLCLM